MVKSRFITHVLLVVLTVGWLAACAAPAPRRDKPASDTAPPPAVPVPVPKPAPPVPPPTVAAPVADDLLLAHNYWRKQIKAPPLVWSEALAKLSREWALTLLRKGVLEHRPNSTYGENIAWFAGERLKPVDVVDNWGNEIEFYDHGKNICTEDSDCEHYTQIVWKNSREVGCGSAWGEHPKYGIQEYWVCNYSPAGNTKGQRPY